MDYKKIGNFIATERKTKKLTQAELAEMLFVSEKTVSKWEKGNGIPGTDVLPKLCEIFHISINELLNGERIVKENYVAKAEEHLLEMKKEKEGCDKILLSMEIVISIITVVYLFSLLAIATFISLPVWLKAIIIVAGVLGFFVTMLFATRIEQKAGYYECNKCHHRYIPTYNQTFWSMHFGRTRYMQCPHCKQRSWNKKVLK